MALAQAIAESAPGIPGSGLLTHYVPKAGERLYKVAIKT
jgi:hypothetical protein